MDDLISTDLIKSHLRLERDDEDDYLSLLAASAVAHFQNWTGCALVSKDAPDSAVDIDTVRLHPDITLGLLMLIAHWYENREAVGTTTMSEAPLGTYALWAQYRVFNL